MPHPGTVTPLKWGPWSWGVESVTEQNPGHGISVSANPAGSLWGPSASQESHLKQLQQCQQQLQCGWLKLIKVVYSIASTMHSDTQLDVECTFTTRKASICY